MQDNNIFEYEIREGKAIPRSIETKTISIAPQKPTSHYLLHRWYPFEKKEKVEIDNHFAKQTWTAP